MTCDNGLHPSLQRWSLSMICPLDLAAWLIPARFALSILSWNLPRKGWHRCCPGFQQLQPAWFLELLISWSGFVLSFYDTKCRHWSSTYLFVTHPCWLVYVQLLIDQLSICHSNISSLWEQACWRQLSSFYVCDKNTLVLWQEFFLPCVILQVIFRGGRFLFQVWNRLLRDLLTKGNGWIR